MPDVSGAGPLMVGVSGLSLTSAELHLLEHPAVCSVLLFARNFESCDQLHELCDAIHTVSRPAPLLVAVDQEGGRVQRFRDGFTALPAMARLGELHDRDAAMALDVAHAFGVVLASELRARGVDFSFTPVLDLRDDRSGVIGKRALHDRTDVIIALAGRLVAGLSEVGMAAVGKHFPGHGSVIEDSHAELPVDARPLAEIRARDLQPFASFATRLPGLLAAHVRFPAVDEAPASFSRRWLVDIARGELGFDGALFSDDLGMNAAFGAGDTAARINTCLAAGCDVALACNEPVEVMLPIACALTEGHAATRLRGARLARMAPTQAGNTADVGAARSLLAGLVP